MIDVENLSTLSIDEKNVKNYVNQMLKYLGVNSNSDVSILFVGIEEMTKQHVRWMNEDGPTDVMSFPMDDFLLSDKHGLKKQGTLGDIIICPEVALKDALEQTISPAKHLVFLLAHGILHLLGQDHQRAGERVSMQEKEQGIMSYLRTAKKH